MSPGPVHSSTGLGCSRREEGCAPTGPPRLPWRHLAKSRLGCPLPCVSVLPARGSPPRSFLSDLGEPRNPARSLRSLHPSRGGEGGRQNGPFPQTQTQASSSKGVMQMSRAGDRKRDTRSSSPAGGPEGEAGGGAGRPHLRVLLGEEVHEAEPSVRAGPGHLLWQAHRLQLPEGAGDKRRNVADSELRPAKGAGAGRTDAHRWPSGLGEGSPGGGSTARQLRTSRHSPEPGAPSQGPAATLGRRKEQAGEADGERAVPL